MIPVLPGAVLAAAVILTPGGDDPQRTVTRHLVADSSDAAAKPLHRSHGTASWVRASLGAHYLASRLPKGTRLRITGPLGSVVRTVNDYGPSRKVFPGRIVDLSRHDFTVVCGSPSIGVCRVTVAVQ